MGGFLDATCPRVWPRRLRDPSRRAALVLALAVLAGLAHLAWSAVRAGWPA